MNAYLFQMQIFVKPEQGIIYLITVKVIFRVKRSVSAKI